MNKQELIESISHLPSDCSGPRPMIDKLTTLELIKLLDETQEVEIPIFVAYFITEQKKLGNTLSYSIDACMSDRVAEWYWDNSELFARAWLDGYTVEEEKRYFVRLKHAGISNSLLKRTPGGEWWFGINFNDESQAHTRKELEEAGFGDVFNSQLFEVKEVEE
ncbi:DUF1642 domain-containing protein [Streptococcus parasanguinis]|uniref:DUF1642 domain-containing protein n=1 Tax=Streptococcus parasanguinis TaxID=1318 RepID=UPI0007790B87|nr:DUF1642 domain-containing protein [Streptococcus parasanguinis]